MFYNFKIIFIDKKKFLLFFLLVPFVFLIIRIQILIGVSLFFCYALFIALILILKTEKTITCEELPVNTDRLVFYSLYNIFFGVPKAKSFLLIYEILYFITNYHLRPNKNLLFPMVLSFVVVFLIKFSIFIILGVSYLSIFITSNFIVNLFGILEGDFETKKSKEQHILMNSFVLISSSVGLADSKKIIISFDNITLNPKGNWDVFFSNVKNPELFLQNYYSPIFSQTKFMYINNHYAWYQDSTKYKNIKLGVNFTSNNKIVVIGENNEEKIIKLDCGTRPNFSGQDKLNFFT